MQLLRRGADDAAVVEVRQILAGLGLLANAEPERESVFDEDTELAVRHFQQRRGISVDGIVGPETYAALHASRWRLGDRVLSFQAAHLLVGDDVGEMQSQLLEMGYDLRRADGAFGPVTDRALRAFQGDYGLNPDGICGPATLRAMRQLQRRVIGGRRNCCASWRQCQRPVQACGRSASSSLPDTVETTPG